MTRSHFWTLCAVLVAGMAALPDAKAQSLFEACTTRLALGGRAFCDGSPARSMSPERYRKIVKAQLNIDNINRKIAKMAFPSCSPGDFKFGSREIIAIDRCGTYPRGFKKLLPPILIAD